jgi:hypothetical protein
LEEALRLLFLSAEKDPVKYDRAARRWLARYATEGKGVSLLKAQLAAASLAELRAGERQQAAKLLIGLAVPPREFGPGLPRPESQLDNSPATEDAPPLGRHE